MSNRGNFGDLVELHSLYEEQFWPLVSREADPKPICQLFLFNADRARALLRSIVRLDAPAHFQTIAATLRLIFEVGVEVELLCNRRQLGFGINVDDIVIRRHELVRDCMQLKRLERIGSTIGGLEPEQEAYVLKHMPDVSRRLKAFGIKCSYHKFEHWLGANLRERIEIVSRFDNQLAAPGQWGKWYSNDYMHASMLAHGSLMPLAAMCDQELLMMLDNFYNWCLMLIAGTFMFSTFCGLGLNETDPSSWIPIHEGLQRIIVSGSSSDSGSKRV